MFDTTVADSLQPLRLAEPKRLWPAWRLECDGLAAMP